MRTGGLDVSHRGGRPGFMRVDGDVLTIPDFRGNRYLNTLGNFLLDPRAGLLFVDFARGDLLHLAGEVEVLWDGEAARIRGRRAAVVRAGIPRVASAKLAAVALDFRGSRTGEGAHRNTRRHELRYVRAMCSRVLATAMDCTEAEAADGPPRMWATFWSPVRGQVVRQELVTRLAPGAARSRSGYPVQQ